MHGGRRNPYTATLIVIGSVSGLVAIILAIVAATMLGSINPFLSNTSALEQAAGFGAWADILGLIAVVSIVGAIVSASITWAAANIARPGGP